MEGGLHVARTSLTIPAISSRAEAARSASTPGAAPPSATSSLLSDPADWPALVSGASLSGMARQLALNCLPASFNDGVLVLKLDESAVFSRSPAVEEKLAQALSRHLGREIRVIYEVSPPSEMVTPARQRVMADQDRAQRAAAAFHADPTVMGLKERFGAEVDAASVKPINP